MLVSFLMIIFAFSTIGLGFAVNNLLKQVDTLEKDLDKYGDRIVEVEAESLKYYKYYLKIFSETLSELKRVDKRGSFSSDDEVGFSFRVIVSSIEMLVEKIKSIEIEEEVVEPRKT